MNIVRKFLLLLFMTAITNTSFAEQGDNGGKGTPAEPECDYISVPGFL